MPAKRQRLPGFTSEFETAEKLNMSVRGLRKWRQRQIGPAWVKVARQIYYPDEHLAAWIKSRIVQPVQEFVVA
jgi:hypothetical protein